jgi:protoporphyrinogen oxidase
MTLALRLAQQGKAVTLFEGAPSLGGLASAWQLGDVVWDRHYHVTLSSDNYLRALLRELGLESEIQWATTQTGFYVDSKLYSLSNTLEFLKFPVLSLVDKVRLGATIFYASRIKDSSALEKTPVTKWLERWSGRNVVDKIWLPLLRAKLGDSYRETSAAFIWASIARMYAARRGGAKTELFGYVPRGYARIIQHFAKTLQGAGVRMRLGQPVRQITSSRSGEVRIDLQNGASEAFDQAVVTAASPLAAQFCPQLTAAEKTQLNHIKYQGIICASALMKKPLSRFYITNVTDPTVPFTAVIEMTALVPSETFGGRSLIYLPKYVASDAPEFGLTDEQVKRSFLDALERMYPQFERDDVLCFQISRVKHLLPIPTLNYSQNLPGISTSIPGVHIVNSTQILNGTLNVNETVQLAELAAQRFALQSHTRTFLSDKEDHEIREENRQPVVGSRQ